MSKSILFSSFSVSKAMLSLQTDGEKRQKGKKRRGSL